MRAKSFFYCLVLQYLLLMSCDNEPTDVIYVEKNLDVKWWVLVHPSYGNSGIHLYNETTFEIEKTLPLPEPNGSPHALDYDGRSLWLGGAKTIEGSWPNLIHNPIYELNPENGEILSTIESIKTSGVSVSNDFIYYSYFGRINKISKSGEVLGSFLVDNTISDLVVNKSKLFYTENGESDPIMCLDINTGEVEFIVETEVASLYTLTIYKNNLVVVDNNQKYIKRFDINTGALVSETEIEIEGWITAITPANIQ